MDSVTERLNAAFQELRTESKDFFVPRIVPRVKNLTALEFQRDYVAQNRPVIITGAVDHWKSSKWTDEYLIGKISWAHSLSALR